jgi:CDP-glucose 4,6-dehydratase
MRPKATTDVAAIYAGKKVLITGHTGFKGSWLTLWLSHLGAHTFGYALDPPTDPSLFRVLNLEDVIDHQLGDVRDYDKLFATISSIKPDIIFHMAAQSVVLDSYQSPLETVAVNTVGSAHILEAVRHLRTPVSVVMVTSDKCYRNQEWLYAYREADPMGGHDPYSASKAAAEILIGSWRDSYFPPEFIAEHGVRVASVRAGNVVGGGDWTKDNLVPDCIGSLLKSEPIRVRNPWATRPWQHVLEALWGYLTLGAKLLDTTSANVAPFCSAFNFGPRVESNANVRDLVEKVIHYWGNGWWKDVSSNLALHEASLLSISIDKSYHLLGWSPRMDFDETIRETIDWYKRFSQTPNGMRDFSLSQIRSYMNQDATTIAVADNAMSV